MVAGQRAPLRWCVVCFARFSPQGGGLTREDDLDAVNGGDSEAIGRLEEGLGANEHGGGSVVRAWERAVSVYALDGGCLSRGLTDSEAKRGLVEVGSELGRVDKRPVG